MATADIRQHLKDNIATVTEVYRGKALQNATLPYIVLYVISTQRQTSHQGDSNLITQRIQVSVYSGSYGQCEAISKDVISELHCAATVGTLNIGSVFLLNINDIYQNDVDIYHRPIDFEINYKE